MAWLGDWSKRRKITVDNTKIDSSLTYFPLTLFLGTSVGQNNEDVSSIFDEVGSSFQKIAITDSSGDTQLYVEKERWDASAEEAVLHVSKSTWGISSTSDETLFLYYDNTKANNTSFVADTGNRTEVWDSGFKGVWHMNQDPSGTAPQMIDSTSNNKDGTSGGSMTSGDLVDSKIGKGLDFDGSDDHIVIPSLSMDVAGTTGWTYIHWIQPDFGSSNSSNYAVLRWKVGSNNNWGSTYNSWAGAGGWDWKWSNTHMTASIPAFSAGDLIMIVGTVTSGGTYTGYFNASEITSASVGSSSGTSDLYIGSKTDVTRPWDGVIDEVMILNRALSSAWIKATYYSGDDNLLDWYAEETAVTQISVSDSSSSNSIFNKVERYLKSLSDSSSGISDINYLLSQLITFDSSSTDSFLGLLHIYELLDLVNSDSSFSVSTSQSFSDSAIGNSFRYLNSSLLISDDSITSEFLKELISLLSISDSSLGDFNSILQASLSMEGLTSTSSYLSSLVSLSIEDSITSNGIINKLLTSRILEDTIFSNSLISSLLTKEVLAESSSSYSYLSTLVSLFEKDSVDSNEVISQLLANLTLEEGSTTYSNISQLLIRGLKEISVGDSSYSILSSLGLTDTSQSLSKLLISLILKDKETTSEILDLSTFRLLEDLGSSEGLLLSLISLFDEVQSQDLLSKIIGKIILSEDSLGNSELSYLLSKNTFKDSGLTSSILSSLLSSRRLEDSSLSSSKIPYLFTSRELEDSSSFNSVLSLLKIKYLALLDSSISGELLKYSAGVGLEDSSETLDLIQLLSLLSQRDLANTSSIIERPWLLSRFKDSVFSSSILTLFKTSILTLLDSAITSDLLTSTAGMSLRDFSDSSSLLKLLSHFQLKDSITSNEIISQEFQKKVLAELSISSSEIASLRTELGIVDTSQGLFELELLSSLSLIDEEISSEDLTFSTFRALKDSSSSLVTLSLLGSLRLREQETGSSIIDLSTNRILRSQINGTSILNTISSRMLSDSSIGDISLSYSKLPLVISDLGNISSVFSFVTPGLVSVLDTGITSSSFLVNAIKLLQDQSLGSFNLSLISKLILQDKSLFLSSLPYLKKELITTGTTSDILSILKGFISIEDNAITQFNSLITKALILEDVITSTSLLNIIKSLKTSDYATTSSELIKAIILEDSITTQALLSFLRELTLLDSINTSSVLFKKKKFVLVDSSTGEVILETTELLEALIKVIEAITNQYSYEVTTNQYSSEVETNQYSYEVETNQEDIKDKTNEFNIDAEVKK